MKYLPKQPKFEFATSVSAAEHFSRCFIAHFGFLASSGAIEMRERSSAKRAHATHLLREGHSLGRVVHRDGLQKRLLHLKERPCTLRVCDPYILTRRVERCAFSSSLKASFICQHRGDYVT